MSHIGISFEPHYFNCINESPIDLWSVQELIQMELEEIITDYLAGEAIRRVDSTVDIRCSYYKSEPFLVPLYNRLQDFNNELGKEPFLKFLTKVFNDWTYLPLNQNEKN